MPELNPYISFRNDAREAMSFYQSVFGGQLSVMTFADIPGMAQDPEEAELVMHSSLTTDNGMTLMAADTPKRMQYESPAGIQLSVIGTQAETELLTGYWERLSQGGTIQQPLTPAPWGDTFGALRDRFGVSWMFDIAGAQA